MTSIDQESRPDDRQLSAENFSAADGEEVLLPEMGSWPSSVHVFDHDTIWAVRAALACQRPLLLVGEPGIGKSQLPRAVAAYFGLPFLSFVVGYRSEYNDLLYEYDPVARLAEAQMAHKDENERREKLAVRRYVRPGPMWWSVNWASARRQAMIWCRSCNDPAQGQASDGSCCLDCGEPLPEELPWTWKPGDGSVLLIDEIDKADLEFPNGLLECLGNYGFDVLPLSQSVRLQGRPPLVVVTSNRERELPVAFVRRCLVHRMDFPKEAPKSFLVERGRRHFPQVDQTILVKVATRVLEERDTGDSTIYIPGAAEFLDIVKALDDLYGKAEDPIKEQEAALEQIAGFSVKKRVFSE